MTEYWVPIEGGEAEGPVVDLTISPDLKSMVDHIDLKYGRRKYPGDQSLLRDILLSYG